MEYLWKTLGMIAYLKADLPSLCLLSARPPPQSFIHILHIVMWFMTCWTSSAQRVRLGKGLHYSLHLWFRKGCLGNSGPWVGGEVLPGTSVERLPWFIRKERRKEALSSLLSVFRHYCDTSVIGALWPSWDLAHGPSLLKPSAYLYRLDG